MTYTDGDIAVLSHTSGSTHALTLRAIETCLIVEDWHLEWITF